MNKKIIAVIGLVILLGVVVVSAGMTFIDQDDGLYNYYETEIVIEKGWNLVSFGQELMAGSEIQESDLKAIYYYNPHNKNYVRQYPESEEFNELMSTDTCGDRSCSVEERADYNSWCYKDCKFELNDDIVSNLNVISQKTLSLSKGEKITIDFIKHNDLEVYWDENSNSGSCVERGYADIDCVMLHFKTSSEQYYDDREFRSSPDDGNPYNDNFGDIILLTDSGPKGERIVIYGKVNYGSDGKYNIEIYEIDDDKVRDNTNQLPEISVQAKILTQPAWVYSTKRGLLKTEDFSIILEKNELQAGWNFIKITPDVIDMLLDKKFGSCDIEKGYFWDIFNKKWIKFPFSDPQQFTWDGDNIDGYGLVIKVSSDCTLGSSTQGPPGLPGDSLNTEDGIFPQNIGDYTKKDDDDFSPGIADGCNEMGSIGEVCMEVILDSAYDNTKKDETLSVGIMKLTKGYNSFTDSYDNHSTEISNNLRKLDEAIYWKSDNNIVVLIQNYKVFEDNSMSSRDTNHDNDIVEYFVNKYSPI